MSNHPTAVTNLSHTIRRFNRFELKYLVTRPQAELFKQGLRAYLVPDDHGDSSGGYKIANLYFDSPDYRFYWEKVEGICVRRKLRIRRYDADSPLADDTPVFVEIKQRVNRVTQKRRVLLPYASALYLCQNRQIPDQAGQDTPVIEEIYTMLWQYNLRPTSLIRYTRMALVGTDYDIGLRVTFDTDLSYRANNLDLQDGQSYFSLFPPFWTIIEIKVNERIPHWLMDLVAVHDLNLFRISKYCRSVELAQHLANSDVRFGMQRL